MQNTSQKSIQIALLIAGAVFLVALLSSGQKAQTLKCPDGANCPVKSLHMVRATDMPRGATSGVVLELRTRNWGGGSCVHASNVNLLKHLGQFEMADWWRKTYIGGEYDSRLISRPENAGLRYAFTHSEGASDDGLDFSDLFK